MTQSSTKASDIKTTKQPSALQPTFGPQYTQTPTGQPVVLFRLWAPEAKVVSLLLYEMAVVSTEPPTQTSQELIMQRDSGGWHQISASINTPHCAYLFKLDSGLCVPDPASRFQPWDVHGPSLLMEAAYYDNSTQTTWRGLDWHEHIFYELHIGTFTTEGTFQGAIEKLAYLKELGITAIELMPVADFPGPFNWGYDGVLLYAPDSTYGRPEDLKAFIDAAHSLGLAVFLDVVYNHFGPEGNYLYCYAKEFFDSGIETPWGSAIAFGQGIHQETIRQFFIQNAVFWLNVYGFDGLRLDAVHQMYDDSHKTILIELAETVSEQCDGKKIHLVLENEDNEAYCLQTYSEHKFYNAQWNDDTHHCLHSLLTGEVGGYYRHYVTPGETEQALYLLGVALSSGFAYQGQTPDGQYFGIKRGEDSTQLPATAMINFLQNHDQIGNRPYGARLSKLTSVEAYKMALSIILLSPAIPMLFMGEEWFNEQPFVFFTHLSETLNEAVRAGRLREFEKFAPFIPEEESVPDPCSFDTFNNIKLDWASLQTEKHQDFFLCVQSLISIRKNVIIPQLAHLAIGQHRFSLIGPKKNPQGLSVIWQGDTFEYGFIANFSGYTMTLDAEQMQQLDNRKIITTIPSTMSLCQEEKNAELDAHSIIWFESKQQADDNDE